MRYALGDVLGEGSEWEREVGSTLGRLGTATGLDVHYGPSDICIMAHLIYRVRAYLIYALWPI